jgi:hypothetical protein
MRLKLLPVALAFFTACSSNSVEPIFEELQLQSIQLHYEFGQIDYDSLTYDNQDQLSRIVRESTGWIDRLEYDFEYQPTSTAVYLTQNGTPSTSFIRKEVYDQSGLLTQVIINKEDGTLFGTNDWTYNVDGTITVEKFGAQGQLEDVETIELDNRGNQVKLTYNNGNSQVIMEYDDKPNPFYGMGLQTVHFQTYSANNQTLFRILQNGNLFFERNYQYQYNAEGYPEQVESFTSLPNDVKETFYFYYE